MDKFLTVIKHTSSSTSADAKCGQAAREKQGHKYRFNPYGVKKADERKFNDWKEKKRTEKILAPLLDAKDKTKPSAAALTKHLMNTLPDKSNPITHSDIYQRSDYVTSAASGHQRSDGRKHQTSYIEARSKKLLAQLPEKPTTPEGSVLYNVRVYINGYLNDTTDIEMKRIVALAGGKIMHTASGATHILTSQQLNGTKTHKHLTAKSNSKPHVVRPEWITDSIKAGKRLPERSYSVIKDTTVMTLTSMFEAGSSHQAPIEVD